MTIPVQFGWPQIILILIAIIGVGLLISSLMSLFMTFREVEILEDEEGRRFRHWRRKRRFRVSHGIGGVLLLLLSLLILFVSLAIQSYVGLTGQIKVAHVVATQLDGTIDGVPVMTVDLTLYDQYGNVTSHHTYPVKGNQWILSGDILEFPSWMNIVGIHSGYKIAELRGEYNDHNLERNATHTVIELNGGDDDFFKGAQAGKYPFASAKYGNDLRLPADGQAYDVCVSQDAVKPCT